MTHELLIPTDSRKPVGFANYAAEVDAPSPLQPMGPTTLGGRDVVYPVSIERSEGRTRIGFSFIPPKNGEVIDAFADRLDELSVVERDIVESLILREAKMRAAMGQIR